MAQVRGILNDDGLDQFLGTHNRANPLQPRGSGSRNGVSGKSGAVHERTPADLIILDVVLPGMSGFEMLKLVKERWPGVPVVFLSGHGQARNIVQAMREGAADFLRKPFEVKELEKILREVLAGQTATICPTCHGAGRV